MVLFHHTGGKYERWNEEDGSGPNIRRRLRLMNHLVDVRVRARARAHRFEEPESKVPPTYILASIRLVSICVVLSLSLLSAFFYLHSLGRLRRTFHPIMLLTLNLGAVSM